MDFYYLKRSLLFDGCSEDEIRMMLGCFESEVRTFEKGEVIHPAGTPVTQIGLILEGSARVEHADRWGNVTVLSIVETGKTINESYAYAPGRPPLLDVVANEDCSLVFMNANRVMHRCPKRCECHLRTATNLTELLALRNLALARSSYILAHRSTRKKVMAFLSLQASESASNEFDIPYNREQLASYLGVDRSALSAELGRMKKAGLIDFRKNHFVLNDKAKLDVI